jgi:16S rRNA processing protein RimM
VNAVPPLPPRAAAGEDLPALPADAVEVARVSGAWGVKGGIEVQPFAADPQALFSSKRWFLLPPETPRGPAARPAAPWPGLLRVVSAREHGDGVVATAQEVPDRDAAEALKGARVFVSRASFPTPDADEFYWVDLIGLDVFNARGEAFGPVVGLVETGPHCVLRTQPAAIDAPEILIPFVDAFVVQVDLSGRRIVVDWEADY